MECFEKFLPMKITKYGIKEFLIVAVIDNVFFVLFLLAGLYWSPWWFAGLVVPSALMLWVAWFFRDPERNTPTDPGLIIAPADGVVADITNIGSDSRLGCDGVKVGIFMNVFNVHVNRSPVDGVVEDVEHVKGLFLDVRDPHSYEKNESASIKMTFDYNGSQYPMVVRQIAGLVARRIVTDLAPKQSLKRGERLGMIKFGSRLEVYIPKALAGKVQVELNQKTKAGETILFKAD